MDLHSGKAKLENFYMFQRFSFDMRQIVLIDLVIWIHRPYILSCGSAKNFDDLKDMVQTRICDKKRSSVEYL